MFVSPGLANWQLNVSHFSTVGLRKLTKSFKILTHPSCFGKTASRKLWIVQRRDINSSLGYRRPPRSEHMVNTFNILNFESICKNLPWCLIRESTGFVDLGCWSIWMHSSQNPHSLRTKRQYPARKATGAASFGGGAISFS